jgi:PAS domain S-box-containing protein
LEAIMDRMVSEMDLADSFFNSLFSVWCDALFLLDPFADTILRCTPAVEDIFGYTSNELIGSTTEVLHLNRMEMEDFRDLRNIALEKNPFFHMKFRMKRKSGDAFPAEHFLSICTSEQGEPLAIAHVVREIAERTDLESTLEATLKLVRKQAREIEQQKAALTILLENQEAGKRDIEGCVLANIRNLVVPYIEQLKESSLRESQLHILRIIESRLSDIVSPFVRCLSSNLAAITPSETRIADLIREGKSTKEIAGTLGLSENTVNFHRQNLRKKLGLSGRRVSLRTFLRTLR